MQLSERSKKRKAWYDENIDDDLISISFDALNREYYNKALDISHNIIKLMCDKFFNSTVKINIRDCSLCINIGTHDDSECHKNLNEFNIYKKQEESFFFGIRGVLSFIFKIVRESALKDIDKVIVFDLKYREIYICDNMEDITYNGRIKNDRKLEPINVVTIPYYATTIKGVDYFAS